MMMRYCFIHVYFIGYYLCLGLVIPQVSIAKPSNQKDFVKTRSTSDPSRQMIFSMDEPIFESNDWRLRAHSIRLLDQPLVLVVKDVIYTPCLNDKALITLQSSTVKVLLSHNDDMMLMLTEPTLKIASLRLPLPPLTLSPHRPQLGIMRLERLNEQWWIEAGPSIAFKHARLTPTVIYGAEQYGIGLSAQISELSLSTKTIFSSSVKTIDGYHLESRGGSNLFSLYGGFGSYADSLEMTAGRSLLRDRLSLRPTRLWSKLTLYENDYLWSGFSHNIDESYTPYRDHKSSPSQRLSLTTYSLHTQSISNSGSWSLRWSGSHHLSAVYPEETFRQGIRTETDPIQNAISLVIGPRYQSLFGESQLLIGGTQGSQHHKTQRHFWVGVEHELTVQRFHKTSMTLSEEQPDGHDLNFPQSLERSSPMEHEIKINPRYAVSLVDETNSLGLFDEIGYGELGLLISQHIAWSQYTIELDSYAGYRSQQQSVGAFRVRATSPYFLVDFKGRGFSDANHQVQLHDELLLRIPFGGSVIHSKPLQWKDWTGYFTVLHSHLETGESMFDTHSFYDQIFVPLSRQVDGGRSNTFEMPVLLDELGRLTRKEKLTLSRVELGIATGPLMLESQISLIEAQSVSSLTEMGLPISIWSRVTWRDPCECWYLSLLAGRTHQYLGDLSFMGDSISFNFGMGRLQPLSMISRSLSR